MPKSKRDKKISLTKVDKKPGLETKQKVVDTVRNSVDTYAWYKKVYLVYLWICGTSLIINFSYPHSFNKSPYWQVFFFINYYFLESNSEVDFYFL